MKVEVKNGIKWISCDNLGELVGEFKKFRNSKNTNERKNYNFDGWTGFMAMLRFGIVKHSDGKLSPSEIINSVEIYQENGVDLSLNVAPLNFREADWKSYSQKIKKILKEIWETGEVKDYQGLDSNWPAVSTMVNCDQCRKPIGSQKLVWFSDRAKDLDFCSESCYSKFKQGHSLEKRKPRNKATVKKSNWPEKYLDDNFRCDGWRVCI